MELKSGYKKTDVGIVPDDWSTHAFGEMFDILRNASDSRGDLVEHGDVGYLHYGDIHTHPMAFLDCSAGLRTCLPPSKAANTPLMQDGDLVMVDASEDTTAIGKAVEIRHLNGRKAIAGLHTLLLRPRPGYFADGFKGYLQFVPCVRSALVRLATGVSVYGVTKSNVRAITVSIPQPPEQRAIAEALSDVDGLIEALEKLIAKKRAIKQAAMQQLLTGHTRLPGFSEAWEMQRLRDLLVYERPDKYIVQSSDYADQGECPVLTANKSFVLGYTTEEFGICRNLPVVVFDDFTTDSKYVDFPFKVKSSAIKLLRPRNEKTRLDFVFGRMQLIQFPLGDHKRYYISEYQNVTIKIPQPDEQVAIAAVLSDMDAEIEALERRRDKTKQIKQGMMQQLLTGRVRLVKPQVSAAQAGAESKTTKAHSWAFNEAVVISTLAKNFGSEKYPLGRKRYTKLAYLLHRHAERQAHGYLKKAAGPYNPRTKYGGPERIAVENGYIREHSSGPYHGFVAANSIAQAEGYFEKWYGSDSIKWLEQFRHKRNDDLELLATADMAAEELRAACKSVDVDGVKDVIRGHSEWQAKLDRPIFSDANIAGAIDNCQTLFGLTEPES